MNKNINAIIFITIYYYLLFVFKNGNYLSHIIYTTIYLKQDLNPQPFGWGAYHTTWGTIGTQAFRYHNLFYC